MKKYKKKIAIGILMGCLILSRSAFAVDVPTVNQADALNYLGLLQGTDKGYELEKGLTRAEAVTMIVRLLGAEKEALANKYEHPFTDVPEWASSYVGYAYKNGITKGTGETEFSPDVPIEMNQYLTFLLRVLGYSDVNGDFEWNVPFELASKVCLLTKPIDTSNPFLRGDMVELSWNALSSNYKTGSMNMSEYLVGNKVFTSAELKMAQSIFNKGKEEALKNKPTSSGSSSAGNSSTDAGKGENSSSSNIGEAEDKYKDITYKVTFYDADNNALGEQTVKRGEGAVAPENPQKSGSIFSGWSHPFDNVEGDTQTTAKFVDSNANNIFYMNSATTSKDSIFDVKLDLRGNVNVASFDFTLMYDNSIFEIVGFNSNPLMDIMAENFEETGEIRFNVVGAKNTVKPVEIFTLNIRVKNDDKKCSVLKLIPNDVVCIEETSPYDIVDTDYNVIDCVVHIE